MDKIVKRIDLFVKKKPTICILILLFVFVLLIGVSMFVSYAYFTANVQGTGKQITISTSNAVVHFTDNNVINETGITPGTSITKSFYVTNTASGSLQYKMNWEYLLNGFINRNCLKYTITSNNGGGTLSSTQVPDSEDHINIINSITIPGNTTQNYTMTITYEDNGQGQNADINSSLIGKIEITDIEGNGITAKTSTGTYTTPTSSSDSLYGFKLLQLMQKVHPDGSIYVSTSSTNPSELFPGTSWERYGKGKILVGLDENDTSFDTSGETGGTKNAVVPYHRHGLNGASALAASAGAHTHDVSGSTSSNGAHTHTIAANAITVKSTATTTSTAVPNVLTDEFEEGVDYGEHGHTVTAVGTNTNTVSISNTGSTHTHSTTASSTGDESSHTHGFNIPSLDLNATSGTANSANAHTHTYSRSNLTSTSESGSGTAHQQHSSWSNPATSVPIGSTVTSGNHYHNVTVNAHSTTAKTGLTTGPGSAHTHSIPSLATDSGGGKHTHTISANSLTIGMSGQTVDSGHAGWHVHTVDIPSLTSKNNSSITVPSTNSGHTHSVTGTAASSGAHEHSLSGYTTYEGTSGNATNANLQPYITVYIWRRVNYER